MATALTGIYRPRPWRRTPRSETGNNAPSNRPGDASINMTDLNTTLSPSNREKKQESLFGPNIGIISAGPKWTEGGEKKVLNEQLTPDVVKSWVSKSKQHNHPTTTLQALVNLKRPSIRLSPLSSASEDETPAAGGADPSQQHLHGLEFEYDCDAPKCGIYMHAFLDPCHPDADNGVPTAGGFQKLLVFEQVVDGGFGKVLKLDDGATLELGKLDHKPKMKDPALPELTTISTHNSNNNNNSTVDVTSQPANEERRKRRFTPFHFRKRIQGLAVTGPALAVVDAVQPGGASAGGGSADSPCNSDDDMAGVRVIIRLAALDENGMELGSVNEQLTYLHIVRVGSPPEGEDGEDTRPWVVQVVKREATIGQHTFHLHEIYGLSSTTATATTTAPFSSALDHSYPPTDPPSHSAPSPVSECLVCLSSPREVVLLPCRHLVACKECALNMVEFGAGGNIVHQENETAAPLPAPAPDSSADDAAHSGVRIATAEEIAQAIPVTVVQISGPPPGARRKRRGKGWNCPVCRQPYTSLLRLTTAPPEEIHKEQPEATETGEVAPETKSSGGGLPGFLRNLGGGRSAESVDLERNAGTA